MPTRLAAVIMAGGLGTRMKSSLVKHLHPILGRRMVDWVVEAARPLGADPLVVVASPATADAFTGLPVAVQEEALGTGDAVRSAREAVGNADEVLVLPGDMLRYGRVLRNADGDLAAIVEAADATPEQLEVREANSSIYVFRAGALWPALER